MVQIFAAGVLVATITLGAAISSFAAPINARAGSITAGTTESSPVPIFTSSSGGEENSIVDGAPDAIHGLTSRFYSQSEIENDLRYGNGIPSFNVADLKFPTKNHPKRSVPLIDSILAQLDGGDVDRDIPGDAGSIGDPFSSTYAMQTRSSDITGLTGVIHGVYLRALESRKGPDPNIAVGRDMTKADLAQAIQRLGVRARARAPDPRKQR